MSACGLYHGLNSWKTCLDKDLEYLSVWLPKYQSIGVSVTQNRRVLEQSIASGDTAGQGQWAGRG